MPEFPHQRKNLLTGDWVLVSPHRTLRPWQGQVEKGAVLDLPTLDPDCYLCPGNSRAGGHQNPEYTGVFSFINDYSALLDQEFPLEPSGSPLFQSQGVRGICKVLCYSPRHDLTLPRLPLPGVKAVVDTWIQELEAFRRQEGIRYVQIFENRGAMMGASNPHPHGQIWAGNWIPDLPQRETEHQEAWHRDRGRCLLCEVLEAEIAQGIRMVALNDSWAAWVPYWALWPFETLLVPRRHHSHLPELDSQEKEDLARILKTLGIKYDNLFQTSFPYSMGLHQAPLDQGPSAAWHLHFHYLPPLLRSAEVKKFMVGYELLAMPQRDLTPEAAAQRIAQQREVHFLDPEAP